MGLRGLLIKDVDPSSIAADAQLAERVSSLRRSTALRSRRSRTLSVLSPRSSREMESS
ncbi:MAG: hypothetical protein WKF84_11970 [Pyrinomonadaceae bacterium]